MAKFKFRLESVLKLKNEQKNNFEIELSLVKEEKIKANNVLEEIYNVKKSTLEKISKNGLTQVKKCQADYFYLDSIEKQIVVQKNKIERIEKRENSIINDLVRITKEIKVIEKLKEKKKESFDKEVLRAENIFLDDISQRLKKVM
jgi:flagellar FliJ protein